MEREAIGGAPYAHLQNADDLVVIVDEHHVMREKAKRFNAAVHNLLSSGSPVKYCRNPYTARRTGRSLNASDVAYRSRPLCRIAERTARGSCAVGTSLDMAGMRRPDAYTALICSRPGREADETQSRIIDVLATPWKQALCP